MRIRASFGTGGRSKPSVPKIPFALRSPVSASTGVEKGCGSLAFVLVLLLFAFVKALHNRRSPWYQRGLIRKPLRKICVILLHDVEHSFLGEPAMVLGK